MFLLRLLSVQKIYDGMEINSSVTKAGFLCHILCVGESEVISLTFVIGNTILERMGRGVLSISTVQYPGHSQDSNPLAKK